MSSRTERPLSESVAKAPEAEPFPPELMHNVPFLSTFILSELRISSFGENDSVPILLNKSDLQEAEIPRIQRGQEGDVDLRNELPLSVIWAIRDGESSFNEVFR